MKTVKDVVAEYPDGWPSSGDKMVHVFPSGDMYFDDSFSTGARSFTREEYERELAKTNTVQWYDYDKQESISLPPVGVECEVSNCGNDYIWCKVVFMGSSLCVVNHKTHNEQHYHLSSVKFRPLDWNKNNERNEFIDECVRVTALIDGQAVIAFGDLYDAGARFND